ncbi:MAG: hypothetical protein GEU96_17595 [Propionibacteriales bacterium]|nr:hypothetical protein [Propionibacteriales bacterium]
MSETYHDDRLVLGGDDESRSDYAAEELRERQREEYGGLHVGAAFYGWLVAAAMAVLLASLAGAIATGVGASFDISRADLDRESETLTVAGLALIGVIVLIAYFAGGYVAGRMTRFDGGRQGAGAWVIGVLTLLALGIVGAVFGRRYDAFDQVDLPASVGSTETLSLGPALVLAAVVLATLLFAILGGKAGNRYHRKVDGYRI